MSVPSSPDARRFPISSSNQARMSAEARKARSATTLSPERFRKICAKIARATSMKVRSSGPEMPNRLLAVCAAIGRAYPFTTSIVPAAADTRFAASSATASRMGARSTADKAS